MLLSKNKRASYDYQLLDNLTVGMQLTGSEVKSIREGGMDISSAYIAISKKNELELLNASIKPYSRSAESTSTSRSIKLLAKKKEIIKLQGDMGAKKLTIIATAVLVKHNLIKLDIALARPKKKADKRASLKEKEFRKNRQKGRVESI